MITRFAPSPTGFIHLGNIRTALFVHLHTKKVGGQWILRIEDTDKERSKPEYISNIFDTLEYLQLTSFQKFEFQSEKIDEHLKIANTLLEQGKAYKCYCTVEELDAQRELQRQRKEKPRYSGKCRNAPPQDAPFVIRLNTRTEGSITFNDLVKGEIKQPCSELDDLILVRSDGTPTYHLAVVVDDHQSDVDLIIRGEDHLPNTPRQIQIMEALEWDVPDYAHIPLTLDKNGKKLGKRSGALPVLDYQKQGYLPSAVCNYLARLGWSYKEQEIFSMEELEQQFSITDVEDSPARFDADKLLWTNAEHIKNTEVRSLAEPLQAQLDDYNIPADYDMLWKIIPTLQTRSKTLSEMASKTLFCFVDTVAPTIQKWLRSTLQTI